MRALWPLAFVIPTLTACSTDAPVDLRVKSVLYASTSGVALRDGLGAHVGMEAQVCAIDVGTGAVLGDGDPGGRERVLDGLGDRVLVRDEASLFVLDTQPNATTRLRFGVASDHARLLDDGLVAVVPVDDGCAVAYTGGEAEEVAWGVPGLDCDAITDLAVDRDSGRAFLVDGASLVRVDRDGVFARWEGVNADRVVLDAGGREVLLGQRGGDAVQAVDVNANPLWSATFDGTIADVASTGPLGLFAVSVSNDAGGTLVLVNTADGGARAEYPLPEAPLVDFAEDGSGVALTTPGAVYFYDVDARGGVLATPTVVSAPSNRPVLAGLGVAGTAGGALLVAAIVAD